MPRIIGIRHRRKRTAEGEARPTQLCILEESNQRFVNLETDDDELNFVRAEFLPGDIVAMVLGGSGDRLAYALSRRSDEIGASVYRIPPFVLQGVRNNKIAVSALPGLAIDEKHDDSLLLAQLLPDRPELFYKVSPRDRDTIALIEAYRYRTEVMKARIACEQRLHQQVVGQIFCSKEGFYPEGKIEDWFDGRKASHAILTNLLAEEKEANSQLSRAAKQLDVYLHLFGPIEGVGPAIGARLIAAIQDIRRFESPAKLKKFLGVHVMSDGTFVRRRKGQVANWHPDGRQALYLLGDQFNRRPDSVWGQKLREYKVKLRQKYPEKVVDEEGKSKYSDGHIHRMATWRTLTKFVEWLWDEWTEFEKVPVPDGAEVA